MGSVSRMGGELVGRNGSDETLAYSINFFSFSPENAGSIEFLDTFLITIRQGELCRKGQRSFGAKQDNYLFFTFRCSRRRRRLGSFRKRRRIDDKPSSKLFFLSYSSKPGIYLPPYARSFFQDGSRKRVGIAPEGLREGFTQLSRLWFSCRSHSQVRARHMPPMLQGKCRQDWLHQVPLTSSADLPVKSLSTFRIV